MNSTNRKSAGIDRNNDWLKQLRGIFRASFSSIPRDCRVKHSWRYTDPEWFMPPVNLDNSVSAISSRGNGQKPGAGEIEEAYAGYGRITDHKNTIVHVDDKYLDSGIVFENLHVALEKREQELKEYFGQLVGFGFGKFESLNLALWDSGFFIKIPDNLVLDVPIVLNRNSAGDISASRLLVIAGTNSQVTIIDEIAGESSDGNSISYGVNEIFGLPGSSVKYINTQNLGGGHAHYLTHRARLDRDARMESVFLSIGGETSKIDAGINLAGEGSDSNLYGFLYGSDFQHFDHRTIHHHSAGNTTSKLDFKAVVNDEANSAYTGLIKIDEDARNCEAYQENRNLILDDDANVESIPELEILNNEVSCSHGVTMGSIDPEMMFYMQSRGIDENDALKMIVKGFSNSILDHVPENISNSFKLVLDNKLNG